MKTRIISILLIVSTLAIMLCSCSVEKQQIVGEWISDNPVYLESYGTSCGKLLIFEDDGTVYSYLFDLKNDKLIEADTGKFTIDGNSINVKNEDSPGTIVYKYKSGKLKNGSWTYVKD